MESSCGRTVSRSFVGHEIYVDSVDNARVGVSPRCPVGHRPMFPKTCPQSQTKYTQNITKSSPVLVSFDASERTALNNSASIHKLPQNNIVVVNGPMMEGKSISFENEEERNGRSATLPLLEINYTTPSNASTVPMSPIRSAQCVKRESQLTLHHSKSLEGGPKLARGSEDSSAIHIVENASSSSIEDQGKMCAKLSEPPRDIGLEFSFRSLLGPRPKRIIVWVTVILALWATFVLAVNIHKKVSSLEAELAVVTRKIVGLEASYLQYRQESSREITKLHKKIVLLQSSDTPLNGIGN